MNETRTVDDLLADVWAYCDAGLSIFPVCWAPGTEMHKRPMYGYAWKATASKAKNLATDDFTRAAELWGAENVMIAWATGLDGKVVIDFDRGQDTELPDWTQAFDWCAATNITGKGRHLICDFPLDMEPGNGASKLPSHDGIDVRGAGGYAIIAGPDRPGFSVSELARCKPFPRPDWLTPYGGPVDAVSMTELTQFAERYSTTSNANMLHGVETACETFEREWEANGQPSRHQFLMWAATCIAEDAIRGHYAFKDGLDVVRAMWKRMTPPERHKRELIDAVAWSVGKALANQRPPTEAADEDESLVLLPDDDIALVNWHEFFTKERTDPEWLVQDLWPFGRHISIGSKAGQGKSELLQYVVSCLALGIDPWTRAERPPMRVFYLDMEMTDEDLFSRMTDFGYSDEHSEQLQDHLMYAVLPVMPALNGQAGLRFVERLVDRYSPDVFIIDTFMKTLAGDENDAATVQDFVRLTGMLLKSRRIASGRADHYGKDPDKGNRGTSAKDDDVDVAWRLVRPQGSYTSKLTATKRRQGFVPERLFIERYHTAERGVFFIPQDSVIANIPDESEHDLIVVMDLLDIPLSWGRDRVKRKLVDNGYEPGANTVLAEAIRLRKLRTGPSRGDAE